MSGPKVSLRELLRLIHTMSQAIKNPLRVRDEYADWACLVVLRPEDARAILRVLEGVKEGRR